jgi:hypothetical protein
VVLTIIWIALNVNIYIRKQKVKQIKSVKLANYVKYVNNFNTAEEEEKKGNKKIAIVQYRKALENLLEEENPDDIVQEAIAEIKERLSALES